MYLLFFVSKLRVEARTKTPVTYLRYVAASGGCEDIDFNEQILNSFCFPLGPDAVQPKEVQASEEYTFTLTHVSAKRFTGFCRQIFPPAPRIGSKARYPQVLCIVAENPWCNFFFKVLQVAEQILKGCEGLLDTAHRELPLESQLGSFLVDLRKQLATNPSPGEVLRSGDRIELQVPPDCGNGRDNSGIPLARLFFHVPVEGMLTLVASLLLERRIVFVARSRDTVTAAVQAAQALIYPFKWQHICLPILPRDLVDYLTAPMPFLVGLTSEMLPIIRHIPMSEVTMVDLDLQKVIPPPGTQQDDGRALPYGRLLGAALDAVFKTVRSPTEYESSPVITGVMQEYFLRLFGSYRRFIHDQAHEPLLRNNPAGSSSGAAAQRSTHGGRNGRDTRTAHLASSGLDGAPSPQGQSGRLHDDMLRGHGFYFDQPAFVAHRRNDVVRSFLNAMRHSQLYQMFVQERLQMASQGLLDLPVSANTMHSSFSVGGCSRAPHGMSKSSSAHNLSALEKSHHVPQHDKPQTTQGMASAASQLAPDARDTGLEASTSGGALVTDPFELRVLRYPELRRLLREHVRSVLAEAAPGTGGSGKLASKLRRHRRTDSEDLHTQGAPGGSNHGADNMRRITTYPGLVDLSVASLADPASYFVEWDMQEDDAEGASASPSPSPRDRADRDRGHMRSESGNSLYSADSGEAAGPSAAVPPAALPSSSSFAFGRGARERDRDRESSNPENTPLRRLSVSMLGNNAKGTYTSLRGASIGSPGPSEPLATTGPGTGAAGGASAGVSNHRMAAFGSIFAVNGADAPIAATVVRGGVQVKTLTDGHRVYDGAFKDIVRLGAAEAKNVLSSIAGLASPQKMKEAAADRQRVAAEQQRQLQPGPPLPTTSSQPQPGSSASPVGPLVTPAASIPLPGMPFAQAQAPLGSSTSAGGASPVSGPTRGMPVSSMPQASVSRPDDTQPRSDRFASLLTGLKDKVAGAGTKALGILHTPHYKPQTTGARRRGVAGSACAAVHRGLEQCVLDRGAGGF
ncbi:hypothetical protein GPECTOR_2g1562 [Gonium pectorale]|uniref:UDENN domain-containing protein n=1 Tax=Gonium pectorale TaxID=33097 RepID=A0A150H362_GONPE|nr:hypothetical protein GPECTOR_2g1562 [Gonium pectorale]|eukprot:KXZ56010.1 hypothetical protein GPECTOR_2g1562 [Gonium pectorale]